MGKKDFQIRLNPFLAEKSFNFKDSSLKVQRNFVKNRLLKDVELKSTESISTWHSFFFEEILKMENEFQNNQSN